LLKIKSSFCCSEQLLISLKSHKQIIININHIIAYISLGNETFQWVSLGAAGNGTPQVLHLQWYGALSPPEGDILAICLALVYNSVHSSTLRIETTYFSETSALFQRNTLSCIARGRPLLNHHWINIKPHGGVLMNKAVYCVRFEFFTAVTMKNGVLSDVELCGFCKSRRFVELSASFIKVTRIGELGTTLAVTTNRPTLRRNTKAVQGSCLASYS
jgi:hypothetical protein